MKKTKVKAKAKPAKPYKIDHGIKVSEPLQRSGDGQPKRATATARLMKVGDSFLIRDPFEAMQASKHLRDLTHRERLNGGTMEFVQRTVKGGTRFWRVK